MKSNLRIVFATWSPWEKGKRSSTNGMVEPMVSFFAPKSKKFILIDQPHPGSDQLIPIVETYENGRLKKTSHSGILVTWLYPILKINNTLKTSIPFKIRDFLSICDFALREKDHWDIFVGLESINTLAGILLKKFGFVDQVVYYVTDFTPKRYNSFLLNRLYIKLDQLAFKQADFVWDVSKEFLSGRVTAGLNPATKKIPLNVPIALFTSQINVSKTKVKPLSIVSVGETKDENGPDLAIQAFKKVLLRIPKAELHIFTLGDTQTLRDLTDTLGIHSKVFFHGLIPNQTELIKILKQFCIGLAPYKALSNSPRWWADASRIRLYLAAGLPVITTQVPPVGKELEEEESGIVTKDNASDLAKAIVSLFKNKKLYNQMKQNAYRQARLNTWDKVYSKTLKDMGLTL